MAGITRIKSELPTELLYCTRIRIRWDLCFDNFCIILTKLMVENRFLHEKSVIISISSSSFTSFDGRSRVWTSNLSSKPWTCGCWEYFKQYWKKLIKMVKKSIPLLGTVITYFLSGTSAFDVTVFATSWIVNILRIKRRQFDSSSTCPRKWNFITSNRWKMYT